MTDVFVFGSNLAGRHGKGAAKFARDHHGAIYGVGYGRQGNSFAIPTKAGDLSVLSLMEIERYIAMFIDYADDHPELTFFRDARRMWACRLHTRTDPTDVCKHAH